MAHTPIRGEHWNSKDKFTFQVKWHIPLSEVGTGAVKIISPFSSSGTYPYQRWALKRKEKKKVEKTETRSKKLEKE